MLPLRTACRTQAEAGTPLSFVPVPLIDRHTKILTLGSCFAMLVKEHLLAREYTVLNHADLQNETVRGWQGRSDFDPRVYYNTFTLRYEFDRACGDFVQDETDIWRLDQFQPVIYQDPYRRILSAPTQGALWQAIRDVDRQMHAHIRAADVLIVTLGLTEVFFQAHNGRAICAVPGYVRGGGQGCAFRATEYPENLENVERIVQILGRLNPRAHVVLTVSPVPLGSTFAGEIDHYTANSESKSTLRAVAGAVARRYDNVHYFHSYEMAMRTPAAELFQTDGRHVQPSFAAKVMREFEAMFFRPAAPLAIPHDSGVQPAVLFVPAAI